METISSGIQGALETLSPNGPAAAKTMRAARVKQLWKEAVIEVYKKNALMVLSSINAVYILREDEGNALIVYSEDSLVRAELDTNQELLKIKMREKGERIDVFRICVPRFDMKKRHPYREDESCEIRELIQQKTRDQIRAEKLTEIQQESIKSKAEKIPNSSIRESFIRAMTADLKSQNHFREK